MGSFFTLREFGVASVREITKEDAYKRATEDYSQFSQYARTAAQFAFTACGGAAAAILTCLTTLTKACDSSTAFDVNTVVRGFAIATCFYLAGILVALSSMAFFAFSKKKWGDAWEDMGCTGKLDFNSKFSVTAQRYETYSWGLLLLVALDFGVASYFAVSGFL